MDNQQRNALEKFFREHEVKAYKMAYVMLNNRDDALELVQDSMLTLVQKYATRDSQQWSPLFYRILHNRIKDRYKQSNFRSLFRAFLPTSPNQLDQEDALQKIAYEQTNCPQQNLQQQNSLQQITVALNALPLRQQQTFVLRAWQEFSVKETAFALDISEGSVKTHYSRAIAQLRQTLESPGTRYE
ncbi:MAG: RNA polymerase sigma-70 factor (ECF subfamily) [Parasphingorhabdus sp.]|jgi:RNA polymerase sigma-70 factor (ECF subfamily)